MAEPMSPPRPSIDERDAATAASGASLARVRTVSQLLDNALRVPGTNIRVGLDPLVGLIPGFGDLLGGLASAYIILEAARAGAPTSILLRMLGNVGIDTALGALPVAGDVFDVAWKSNARNVRLLERHLEAPRETRSASIALGLLVVVATVLLAVAGVALTFLIIRRLFG
jgi:hypothetical protein